MSVQSGSQYYAAFVDLVDTNGNVIDTAAHLHITNRAGAVTVLTRAAGQITYTHPSTDPDSGAVALNKYEAALLAGAPGVYTLQWHFPDITYVAPPYTVLVAGPVLTEPAP